MRKLILFFAGLILLALMFATLLTSGFIYDTSAKITTEPYFFQPNDNYTRRLGKPQTPAEIGDEVMRSMLISKYITEFFYITPDTKETALRVAGKTSLARMSTSEAFQTWLDTVAPRIEDLSKSGALRTVSVVDAEFQSKTEHGEYWRIVYELKTWERPNDFLVSPTTKQGVLYMDIYYQPGMRSSSLDISEYLESGGDPAAVFRFGVFDVVLQE